MRNALELGRTYKDSSVILNDKGSGELEVK